MIPLQILDVVLYTFQARLEELELQILAVLTAASGEVLAEREAYVLIYVGGGAR